MGRPTDEQLAAIRERCDKATEGPWKAEVEIDGIYAGRPTVVVSSKRSSMLTRRVVNVSQTRKCVENEENNIEFIAHAREDIPLLLAEIEHLKWELSHEYYEGFKHGHSKA